MRAFSLIETLIILIVLAVLLALTLPQLAPVVWQGQLRQAAEDVAETVHAARLLAMARGRCVRVRDLDSRTAVVEVLNSYDCDGDPEASPRADPAQPLWQRANTLELPREGALRLMLPPQRVPTVTRQGRSAPATGQNELRFRPNGRLMTFGEHGVFGVELAHDRLPRSRRTHVLVEPAGPQCIRAGTVAPAEGCS